ncbi:MAG: RtcB family protein [Defluviitaleaceae bacterium]|nr:RtcB family protein [Defluviitaleaceae bacterium]
MIKVTGKYNTAVCYTSELEDASLKQIQIVCDRKEFADCKIRIMPDVHAGMGCTIGTTMTINDKIVPNMVGVDIGCGMETVKIAQKEIDYDALDKLIRQDIPSGFDVRSEDHPFNAKIDLTEIKIADKVKMSRVRRSIGTLGGGNHFIEVGRSDEGDLYIIVHSGSRSLGTSVAEYYQEQAFRAVKGSSTAQIGIDGEISKKTKKNQKNKKNENATDIPKNDIPKDLAYATGDLFNEYIHDMKITQHYAALNRLAMIEVILRGMKFTEVDRFTTIHNYIDTDAMILRKGATSARAGERLLIPINMRDGSLICIGKGNEDWNYSAPHGAGRLMSRSAALKSLSVDDFKTQMSGVFTTSVNRKTLDEAPMAYKSMDEIISHISPTADILTRLRPTYNFKAS